MATPHHPTDPHTTATASLQTRSADFGEVYRAQHHRVAAHIAARLGVRHRDSVEDLVQDTFYAALTQHAPLDADALPPLLRLADQVCRRHLHATGRDQAVALVADRIPSPPATTTATGLTRDDLADALRHLPGDQHRVIDLLYLQQYTPALVAARMGRSVQAVRGLRRRALRRLHRHLTAAVGQPHPRTPRPGALTGGVAG